MMRDVKRSGVMLACALLLANCSSEPPKSLVTPLPPIAKQPVPDRTKQDNQPMRGVWLATVSRLDWPPVNSVNVSSPALRIRLEHA
jgi:uncharacterized lipoprotein YddW (UPF0748 family)